ncbi:GGDEF domain-containing protein, partial [Pseudoalteromonas ruthenica]
GRLSFPYFHDVKDDLRAEDLEDLDVAEISKSLTAYALTKKQVCNFTCDDIEALISQGTLEVLGSLPKQWLCFPLLNR